MLELKTVILDCKDIPQLLDFYGQLLNWPVVFQEDTFVRIQSKDTGIVFQISAYWIILSEERWCVKKFGEEYINYMNKVRRYI